MALLEVTGISKNFGSTHVLQNISLNLEKGEALAIIGSSGSGKTTLLRCLNFLETPDTGVIRVDGKALWDAGINYLHGTCHGIGHCLNVHEGPQSIRMEENPVILEPGMVMSDEPAIYRPGEYGIRTENMILIREDSETEFGKFLGFETLTLCYIDTKLVIPSMLSVREHAWLNKYHQMVYDLVSPHLTEEEKAWLKEKTAEI